MIVSLGGAKMPGDGTSPGNKMDIRLVRHMLLQPVDIGDMGGINSQIAFLGQLVQHDSCGIHAGIKDLACLGRGYLCLGANLVHSFQQFLRNRKVHSQTVLHL